MHEALKWWACLSQSNKKELLDKYAIEYATDLNIERIFKLEKTEIINNAGKRPGHAYGFNLRKGQTQIVGELPGPLSGVLLSEVFYTLTRSRDLLQQIKELPNFDAAFTPGEVETLTQLITAIEAKKLFTANLQSKL